MVIALHVGQCGVGLGRAFWDIVDGAVELDAHAAANDLLLECDGQWTPKCVLVDTEPRVIQGMRAGMRTLSLHQSQVVAREGGAAGIWAVGRKRAKARPTTQSTVFASPSDSSSVVEQALEGVRRIAERCWSTPHFVLTAGLSGGTGGGVGSQVLQALRDEHPSRFIVTLCAASSPHGDSPCQSVNAVLAGSSLQAHADCNLLVHNDVLTQHLFKYLVPPSSFGAKAVRQPSLTFGDLNGHVARALACLLLPCPAPNDGTAPFHAAHKLADIVTSVTPDPSLKFAQLRTTPVARDANWAEVARSLRVSTGAEGGDVERCGASLLLAQGPLADQRRSLSRRSSTDCTDCGMDDVLAALTKSSGLAFQDTSSISVRHSARCPAVLVQPQRLSSSPVAAPLPASSTMFERARTLTLAANSSAADTFWRSQVESAAQKVSAGAYMHWYEANGCAREEICDAVHCMAGVADAYRWMYEPL